MGELKKEKYIYCITNLINGKQYVGQTKMTLRERFQQHCCNRKYVSLIARAIQKYGKENFKIEELYFGPDYNYYEKYWIKELNTLIPNGYNIEKGGEEPPILKGEQSYRAKLTEKEVEEIKNELMLGCSVGQVQKKFNKVSVSEIARINSGKFWHDDNLNYPLVKPGLDFMVQDEIIEQIIEDIKYSNLSLKDIGKKYNLCKSTIVNINQGKTKGVNKFEKDFPIRKRALRGNDRQRNDSIICYILLTNKSLNQISKQHKTTSSTVCEINQGTIHKYNFLKYPLRKNKEYNKSILEKDN